MAKNDKDVQRSIAGAHDDMLHALGDVLREDKPAQDMAKIVKRARAILVIYTGLRIMVRAMPDIEILQDAKKAALEI